MGFPRFWKTVSSNCDDERTRLLGTDIEEHCMFLDHRCVEIIPGRINVGDVLELIFEFLPMTPIHTVLAASHVCQAWRSRINQLPCWSQALDLVCDSAPKDFKNVTYCPEAAVALQKVPTARKYFAYDRSALEILLVARVHEYRDRHGDSMETYLGIDRYCRSTAEALLKAGQTRRSREFARIRYREIFAWVCFFMFETIFYSCLCATSAAVGWHGARGHGDVVAGLIVCFCALALSLVSWGLLWFLPVNQCVSSNIEQAVENALVLKPTVAVWPIFVAMHAGLCSIEAFRFPAKHDDMFRAMGITTGAVAFVGCFLMAVATHGPDCFSGEQGTRIGFLGVLFPCLVAIAYSSSCLANSNFSGCVGVRDGYIVPLSFAIILLIPILVFAIRKAKRWWDQYMFERRRKSWQRV